MWRRIAANKLDSLFEKFTQCSTSTTSTYGGTGLGLAVSKRLVSIKAFISFFYLRIFWMRTF